MNNTNQNYQDFWTWFQQHEKQFYQAVLQHDNIERDFFELLAPKLEELNGGFYFLTGMNEDIAELIITPDGVVKEIALVEELVHSAPKIQNWNIIALKPAVEEPSEMWIDYEDYEIKPEYLHFYAIEDANFPDEIDIVLVYDHYKEDDDSVITNGLCVFLDNFLGELHFVTIIDNLSVIGRQEATQKLIPILKLPAYLLWRQKEFVENYEGVFYTEKSKYAVLKATTEAGKPLIVSLDSAVLQWNAKASHPWLVAVELFYPETQSGLPDTEANAFLDDLEDELMQGLPNAEGYLWVARQTAEGVRTLFWACKEFKNPSNFLHSFVQLYEDQIEIRYDIFKDKYWRTFDKFLVKKSYL